jgi:hypothetical protein
MTNPATPVESIQNSEPSWFAVFNAQSTAWALVIEANPKRRKGVYVQNNAGRVTTTSQVVRYTTDPTQAVTTGIEVYPVFVDGVSNLNNKTDHFFPGTGPVYVTNQTGSVNSLTQGYEY